MKIEWGMINDLSEVYLLSLPAEELWNILEEASDLYYNQGSSPISDKAFDFVQEVAKARDPNNNPRIKKIGAPVKGNKVKLPFYMHSLDKIKKGENSFEDFLQEKVDYVVSEKLDGVSLLLCENNGEWNIYSRGDGFFGGRLRFLEKVANLPSPIKGVSIRAEAVVSKKVFAEKYAKKYENARNMVSGLLNPNRVSANEAINDIEIIAYEVLHIHQCASPNKQFLLLEEQGFQVPFWHYYNKGDIDFEEAEILLPRFKLNSDYEIDGLVITKNKSYERPIEGNPDYSKAFKMDSEDETAIVEVIGIDWQVSRYGYLKPVILIEPTRLCGVTISKVTGHNAYFIRNGHLKDEEKPCKPIGPGAKIKIIRSGDVIPKVLDVIDPYNGYPVRPNGSYDWNESGVDFVATHGSEITDVEVKKLTHFFKTIKADGIDIGLCTKFYESGLKTVFDVVSSQQHRFLAIEGIQHKTAKNIVSSIRKALNGITMETLMDASGCFGRAIGPKRIKMVLDVISYEKFQNYEILDIVRNVKKIHGFDITTAELFADGMVGFKKFYKEILPFVLIAKVEPKRVVSSKFQNLRALFTGFRDKDLENYIVENGGKIASGIASTNLLLVKDLNKTSEKMKQAIKKDIEVMSVADFKKMYELI